MQIDIAWHLHEAHGAFPCEQGKQNAGGENDEKEAQPPQASAELLNVCCMVHD